MIGVLKDKLCALASVDLCASLFRVCGRYGDRAQKSRDTNDPSKGYRVLVAGIAMISTVGEAILLEGTSSMQADGIDVGVSAISRRWDLATSICSKYFFLVEIGRYKNNYPVTLTLNPGWTPYLKDSSWTLALVLCKHYLIKCVILILLPLIRFDN